MITLITGAPGTGKTALAIWMALEERGTGPLFVMGIPELKVEHQPVPPVEEWTREIPVPEDPTRTRPVFTFPEKSTIILDECQNVFRPRPVGSKVPPYVAAFETHRHTGVNFWLITQDYSLLDANVRKLIGRHIHVRNTALGRRLYEWPEVGHPDQKSSRDIAASRRYKLPKKVFGLYKSATVHLKSKERIPNAAYMLAGAVLVIGFLGYKGYTRFNEVTQGSPFGTHAQQVEGPTKEGTRPGALPVLDPIAQHLPRIEGLPHTAPRYDAVTQPKRVPIPAACISTSSACTCWTQQATRIQVTDSICRQIVANGIFIDFDVDLDQKRGEEPHQVRSPSAVPASTIQAKQEPITPDS